MTEEEIIEKENKLKENALYQKSYALHKEYQYRQFSDRDGIILNGEHSRDEIVNGTNGRRTTVVIYRFKNGLLHSYTDKKGVLLPAIEYLSHWEYWTNGIINTVIDSTTEKNINERWENGIPQEQKFETNLQNNIGEQ